MLFPRLLATIPLLLTAAFAAHGQTAEIRGFLKEAENEEVVPFTVVQLMDGPDSTAKALATQITNENGYFAFPKLQTGTYTLWVNSMAYAELRQRVSAEKGQKTTVKLFLEAKSQTLSEVVVDGQKLQREKTVNIGVQQVKPVEIRNLPSMGGEADLTQYVTTLPGVVSTGDQGGQVYIRGGAPYQTLTLMDGMVAYNPFHSIGLYSIFDTDILKSVELSSVAFGAEYGGRTSAVLDVKTIDGNAKQHSGVVSANPTAGKIAVNGPIAGVDKDYSLTYVLSARHAWLNNTAKTLYPYAISEGEETLPFSFTDVYAKSTLTGREGSKVSLYGFNFLDEANLNYPASFGWQNSGVGGSFLVLPGGASSLINGEFGYSNYRITQNNSDQDFSRESRVRGFNGQLDFTYFQGDNEIHYGLGMVGMTTTFEGGSPVQNSSGTAYEENNSELFGFFNYLIVGKKLVFEPGLRIHHYASLNNSLRLEPRAGLKYKPHSMLRLKAAFGLYSQSLISARSEREVVDLFNGFITKPVNLSARQLEDFLQTSRHYVLGLELEPKDWLYVNVEAYVKDFSNIIVPNRLWVVTEEPINAPDFVTEDGFVQGIDLELKARHRKLEAKASYSYLIVTRDFMGLEYHPNFDRRHTINATAGYNFGEKHKQSLNLNFTLGSGFPFTQTIAFYERLGFRGDIDADYTQDNGQLGLFFGDVGNINKGRLPWYHRLDLAYRREIEMGERLKWVLKAGATNIYNRANVFYVDRVDNRQVDQLPLMPYAGVEVRF